MNPSVWLIIGFIASVKCAGRVMEEYRVPENLEPTHYKLRISTSLTEDFAYSGKVWIDVFVKQATDTIILNSKNLNINENETTIEELNTLRLSGASNVKKTSSKIKIKRDTNYASFRRLAMRERKKPKENEEKPAEMKVEKVQSTTAAEDPTTASTTSSPPVTSPAPEQPLNFTEKKDDEKKLIGILPKDPKEPMKEDKGELKTADKKEEEEVMTNDKFVHGNEKEVNKDLLKDPESEDEKTKNKLTMPSEIKSDIRQAEPSSESPSSEYTTEAAKQTSEAPSTSTTTQPSTTVKAKEETSTVPSTTTTTTTTTARTTTTTTTTAKTTTTSKPISTTTVKVLEQISESKVPESTGKPDDGKYKVTFHDYDTEKDFIILRLQKPLVPNRKYRLQMSFQGFLTDTLTGFHRVAYSKKNSKRTTWLASTVFEPLEARTAFPCFDEPEYKATFDIVLGHEKKFTALSNMPLKTTAPMDDKPEWQWSIFERSPKMSPYLVAFLISDLEYLTPKKQNQKEQISNTTYRFWARQDVLHKTRYAMKIVPDMKNYIEELIQVPDPMPKHDFVALPSFVSSALENWGLVAFAEKNLLFTPGYSSIFSKYEITQILGHEISHMWFGNLVTPKWWDQVWLSEGFSNFFEVLAADRVQPSWDVKTIALVFSYLKVFSIDAMHSSHPLVPEVKTPNDLNEIFDSISYQKGYYIVRMLNHTLGEPTFMKGVRSYVKKNMFSSVEENDLWECLTKYGHEDQTLPADYHLKDLMRSWTRETGYPVIDVVRNYENRTANITQRRFLRPKEDYELRENGANVTEKETKWWIPLTYTTGSELRFDNTKPRVWIKPEDDVTVLNDMPEENKFVLMNLEAAGLYRVNYDYRNWELIIGHLLSDNYSDISVINRVQILDDLLDFARAGEITYSKALDATRYLQKEKHFLPWKAALSNFEYISRMFRSTDNNRTFKKFMRGLISPRLEELGFEPKKNDTMFDGLNRKQIIKWACRTGNRQCTRKSINLFKKWSEEKKPDEHNPVPSNLRSVVYCTAIEHGGAKDWSFLWQRYLANLVATDKNAILYGLGCSRNSRTLKKYLEWALKESSGIKKQDSVTVFKAVAKNDIGFGIAKDFFKERLPDIKKYYGNNPYYLPQMLDALAAKMNQPAHLEELEGLEDEHFSTLRTIPRSFKQATERVKFNIGWLEQNYKPITDWLKEQRLEKES